MARKSASTLSSVGLIAISIETVDRMSVSLLLAQPELVRHMSQSGTSRPQREATYRIIAAVVTGNGSRCSCPPHATCGSTLSVNSVKERRLKGAAIR
jgi:hypothetical protein